MMKISIEKIDLNQEEEILIKCHEVDDKILSYVKNFELQYDDLIGYEGDIIHRLKFVDVYYFEAVDNKVFIYCRTKSMSLNRNSMNLKNYAALRNSFVLQNLLL